MNGLQCSTCFVGINESGARHVWTGVEERRTDSQMVPDEAVDPQRLIVNPEDPIKTVSPPADSLVVVTGSLAEEGSVETAVRVGDACHEDAVTVAIFSGDPRDSALESLTRAFGTVVPVPDETLLREFVTDLCTVYSQPMSLRADYGHITTNLVNGGIAVLSRHTNDRTELHRLETDYSDTTDALMGYVEMGARFTVGDAEQLKQALDCSEVVTGQATLDTPTQCRVTFLRQADGIRAAFEKRQ